MSNKQSSVNKEFVSYEQALELKELGFNEECLGRWLVITEWEKPTGEIKLQLGTQAEAYDKNQVAAPLYQQAFTWFRDKKLLGLINPIDDWNIWAFSILAEDCMSPFFEIINSDEYKSYEEAEIECLKKLIEIANEK